jgi:hypothetical protein
VILLVLYNRKSNLIEIPFFPGVLRHLVLNFVALCTWFREKGKKKGGGVVTPKFKNASLKSIESNQTQSWILPDVGVSLQTQEVDTFQMALEVLTFQMALEMLTFQMALEVHTFQMALEVLTFQMALEVHTFQMALEVHTFQMALEVHTFQMALHTFQMALKVHTFQMALEIH